MESTAAEVILALKELLPSAATIGVVKDIVLAAAAIVTGWAAMSGLNAWRRELTGKAQFETARALVKATYRLRDEIAGYRNPLVSGGEFPAGYTESADASATADAWAHVYQNRWKPVLAAIRDFDAAVLEAEALWGDEVRAPAEELRHCVRALRASTVALIENYLSDGEDFKSDREFGIRVRAEVHASASDADNELSKKIVGAVQRIEALARPHLKR